MKSFVAIFFTFITMFDAGFPLGTSLEHIESYRVDSSQTHISQETGGSHKKENKRDNNYPFHCHACIEHCHASHNTLLSNRHNIVIISSSMKKFQPIDGYKIPHKTIYLNPLFRPPIFS